jgi:hypothetical protein
VLVDRASQHSIHSDSVAVNAVVVAARTDLSRQFCQRDRLGQLDYLGEIRYNRAESVYPEALTAEIASPEQYGLKCHYIPRSSKIPSSLLKNVVSSTEYMVLRFTSLFKTIYSPKITTPKTNG